MVHTDNLFRVEKFRIDTLMIAGCGQPCGTHLKEALDGNPAPGNHCRPEDWIIGNAGRKIYGRRDSCGQIGHIRIYADLRAFLEHMGMGVNQSGKHIFSRGVHHMPCRLPFLISGDSAVINRYVSYLIGPVGRVNHMSVLNQ